MDTIQSYETFIMVVETKSFSKAAKALHLSQPSISRIVSDLEKHLNNTLLHRNAKNIVITEKGKELFKYAKTIVGQAHYIENKFKNTAHEICGDLNIAIPIFWPNVFYTLISKFLKLHPKVSIKLHVANTYHNLLDRDIDMAIRVGENWSPKDTLKKTIIGQRRLIFVSSKDYLKSNEPLKHPRDLLNHNCLLYTPHDINIPWSYTEKKSIKKLKVSGNLQSYSMIPLVEAIEDGLGVGYLPDYYLGTQIKTKNLVQVLTPFTPPPHNVYVTHPYTHFVPEKITKFQEFLSEHAPERLSDS